MNSASKAAETLSRQFSNGIDLRCLEYMDKYNIELDEFIDNTRCVTQAGHPNDMRYFYKDKEIFRVYLEVCDNKMRWVFEP